jgi:hypothetical protein
MTASIFLVIVLALGVLTFPVAAVTAPPGVPARPACAPDVAGAAADPGVAAPDASAPGSASAGEPSPQDEAPSTDAAAQAADDANAGGVLGACKDGGAATPGASAVAARPEDASAGGVFASPAWSILGAAAGALAMTVAFVLLAARRTQ